VTDYLADGAYEGFRDEKDEVEPEDLRLLKIRHIEHPKGRAVTLREGRRPERGAVASRLRGTHSDVHHDALTAAAS